ncbi:putative piggybac transposable element-derived [Nephila pilipes]|uniref:Putative piggybac transposable element-derived n=1 Tax=Nephila pilipes TaxID=299642 RepID=A0A8X6QML7_NEPPI|nr:putative piggybac transposable element-derived [Nephila pilipes]
MILDVDECMTPPNESGDVSETEDINDEDLGEIIPRDATGENDNTVVTVATNHQTLEPISNTKRYSKSVKRKIDVTQPALIKSYNGGMGGVNVLDKLLSSYRRQLRNKKKWYRNLFANSLNISVTVSWIIYRGIHGKNSMPHLEFRR